MEKDISSYVEDIISAIGEDSDIDREKLEKEFRKFLEYGVPPDQAKKTLVEKFSSKNKGRRLLSEIKPNETSVNLLCRIITVNPREIKIKGEPKKIFYGLLGDESGIAPFTSWDSSLHLEKGDVVEVKNAYVREWQDNIQVNFGERTIVKKVEDDKLPDISYKPKLCKIAELHNTFGPVEVLVKVLDISKREIETDREEKREVFSGIIGDETGKARFTAWHDYNIQKNDVIKISGGYARFWKGIPQLVFDERAEVKKVNQDIKISSEKTPLHKLVERKGGLDIVVEGTVIEIREGSGYIERCPECKRPIENGECKVHGKVRGIPDLRIKMVVDDGTAGIGVILGKELTEKLIGKTLEECKEIASNDGNEKVMELLRKKLLTQVLHLRGNAIGDEFGTTLIAREAEIVEQDLREEVAHLLERVEEL